MKLTLAVHRKEGRPGYGSEGASAEITLDLSEATVSDNPLSLIQEAQRVYGLLDSLVADQLAKSAADVEPSARRPPEPEPWENPVHCNGSMAGIVAGNNSRPPARQPARQEPRDDTPRDGRQLIAWARRREESGECPGLFRRLTAYGKAVGFPSRVVEWTPDDVAAAVDAVMGDGDPEPQPAPASRNGHNGYHHNGHSNGNGYHR
jgi:hypothetical protein